MFQAGFFSADPRNPLRVDAQRLVTLNASELADGFQVLCYTSDDPMIARRLKQAGCDFIHLGQEDLDTADIPAIRRAGLRLGVSTHDAAELERALALGPDYVALGPVYTTILTGARRPGELDGPDEFHLVLLDHGRSRVLATPFRESLQCIRCGACLNACPVYRRIGGHPGDNAIFLSSPDPSGN